MPAATPEQQARYNATPRQCVDCGGKPMAGYLRCKPCHYTFAAGGVDLGAALREETP